MNTLNAKNTSKSVIVFNCDSYNTSSQPKELPCFGEIVTGTAEYPSVCDGCEWIKVGDTVYELYKISDFSEVITHKKESNLFVLKCMYLSCYGNGTEILCYAADQNEENARKRLLNVIKAQNSREV